MPISAFPGQSFRELKNTNTLNNNTAVLKVLGHCERRAVTPPNHEKRSNERPHSHPGAHRSGIALQNQHLSQTECATT